jgi:hypothetical protein
MQYRSRECWTTINNRRFFGNTALLIRAGVECVLIPETGHEMTTEGRKIGINQHLFVIDTLDNVDLSTMGPVGTH